jgi:diguanylate cyclase (GGDEF)-like protein
MEFNNFIENDKLKKKIGEISEIDPLTGTYNRRFFNNYLDIEIKRQKSLLKYSHSREVNFGIAVIDIDDFKDVNDNYGHLVGDAVLLEVAETIKAIIFERDILCRYGGEEFVVLFTSTPKSGAMIAIEKILGTIENHKFMINRENSKIKISITVSIGFASFDEDVNIYKLLEIADKRLYIAKETGKNRVVYE